MCVCVSEHVHVCTRACMHVRAVFPSHTNVYVVVFILGIIYENNMNIPIPICVVRSLCYEKS